MSWRDDPGVPDLIRRAYAEPVSELPDDGRPLSAQVFDYVGQAMRDLEQREEGLRTRRSQLEAAAELLRAARQELATEREAMRRDRYLNASVAAGLVTWTTYCLEWSHVPPPVLGAFLLVAGWATFYHYRGRRWLQGA